jgi:uncharacterized protein (TIGR02118 family)
MVKVSVMYPNTAGARFDHEYYQNHHMPLVKAMLAERCLRYTVDRGLSGGASEVRAPYVAMCHVFCDSEQAFQDGMALHGKEIFDDIANFTDLVPVIQISEVVVD